MLRLIIATAALIALNQPTPVRWDAVLSQPGAWYGSPEARAIAGSVLAWQLDTGAWPKNIDMSAPPRPGEKPAATESTIDNGATTTQIRYLGRVFRRTTDDSYRRAILRGIEYLLAAQYPNGGWPQYFPVRKGYYSHITYNDDAMARTMMLLWDAADGTEELPPFDAGLRARARAAVEKGIEVILKTQIRVDHKLTAWCQQHDEMTFEPRPARTFEPIALVSAESAGIVRVLMRIEKPEPRVVEAIEAAIEWLRAVRIDGHDRWARFYQIGTNRPIFVGRDAIVRYRVEEIEEERQKGYSWYGDYAATLINRDYPVWRKRLKADQSGYNRWNRPGTAMLTDTLYRHPRTTGIQTLQQRGQGGARELTTRRLRLDAGSTIRFTSAEEETVVVLQEGRGTFAAGGGKWTVSRKNVFAERATALYLPRGAELVVRAETPLEAVLFSTPTTESGAPALVRPEEISVAERGKGIYTREVHNIFVDDQHVRRLMVGETFNPSGHWSSYPPHKHDGRDGEPTLEEVYYYRVDPPQGFGQQLLYTNDGESVTHSVHDGDTVLLPYGYHPVSSPPGYRLYYLWGMAGEQRKLALHEDPAHKWIHNAQ